jgi:hypothetical protein
MLPSEAQFFAHRIESYPGRTMHGVLLQKHAYSNLGENARDL